ncbi:hypothetical protein [Acetobacter fallax]|uniref:Uncharacterized protein n=1 Tax=Acetobacter fallax TaxID=1737473 RepID=A0ABX0K916_9PROT|nr:hypothetical protein [Acetobacter fallax]NHO32889.1 hypothetical protein [Acetobacter fallax]NHO36451.1 hypothetical protein [Acetobacter fallax]
MPAPRPAPSDAEAFVIRVGNNAFPLRIRGQPIQRLYPGWHIYALNVTLLPMAVALLRDEGGAEAYWLFDGELNYRASTFGDLDEEERSAVVGAIAPFFRSLAGNSLGAMKQVPTERAEAVRNLSPVLRDELLAAWLEQFPQPRCVARKALPQGSLSFAPDALPLASTSLAPLLSAADGLSEEPFPLVLSPYGQSVLRGHHVLRDDDLVLTRFVEPAMKTVFYLGMGKVPGENTPWEPVLYSPRSDLIMTDLPAAWASQIPARLLSWFMADPAHVSAAPDEVVMDPGGSGRFMPGRASSLPVTPPALPGNWPGNTAVPHGAGVGELSTTSLSEAQIADAFRSVSASGAGHDGDDVRKPASGPDGT